MFKLSYKNRGLDQLFALGPGNLLASLQMLGL